MTEIKKRLLSGLMAFVMALSLLPAQALAEELDAAGQEDGSYTDLQPPAEDPETPEEMDENAPDGEALPYFLVIAHALELDGVTYGQTDMVPLTEADFVDGVYDFSRNVLSREGMVPVQGRVTSQMGDEITWTVPQSAFYLDEDGYWATAYIDYAVADGYTASYNPNLEGGTGDVSLFSVFEGNLGDIVFNPADVLKLTVNFEYSRTGGMAGASAADSVVIEVVPNAAADENGCYVEYVLKDLPSYSTDSTKYAALENFRIVLDPVPLNKYLVRPSRAEEVMEWTVPFGVPQQQKLEEYLEDGSFNVQTSDTPVAGEDTRPGPVYWVNDTDNNKDGVTNKFNNRYSYIYNDAWNSARSIGGDYFTARASSETREDLQGANPITKPELTITINQAQWTKVQTLLHAVKSATTPEAKAAAQTALDKALTITVYYRRNASFYNVEHWVEQTMVTGSEWANAPTKTVPVINADGTTTNVTYKKVFTEQVQGRVGALTNAKDSPVKGADNGVINGVVEGLTHGTNPFDFGSVVADTITQKVIEQRDEATGAPKTTVEIYYHAATAYRVIFDTNDAYIPRQQINLGEQVIFDTNKMTIDGKEVPDYKDPTRPGYTFAGWAYRLKDGVTAEANDFEVTAADGKTKFSCRPLTDETTRATGFTLNQIIGNAYITNADETDENAVKALMLYPMWSEATANVRVVFWTENLKGKDTDVATGDGSASGVTAPTHSEAWTADYSNVGSFTFQTRTGTALLEGTSLNDITVGNQVLSELIANNFKTAMKSTTYQIQGEESPRTINFADYYSSTPAHYEVSNATTGDVKVAADGTTVLYVYYTRNVYTLHFQYYVQSGNTYKIASNTNGFALGKAITGTGGSNGDGNQYQDVPGNSVSSLPGHEVTIKAKYGADLRDVWPQPTNNSVSIGSGQNATTYRFVSWSTSDGPYNLIARGLGFGGGKGEPTIMGVYGSLSWELIKDPQNPSTSNEFLAYWWNDLTHYTYNHCFEIPGLTKSVLTADTNVEKKDLYSTGSSNTGHDEHDILYLVPVDGEGTATKAIQKYGFTDLMKVGGVDNNGHVTTGQGYYAVRIYTVGSTAKCYALARQVPAVSSAKIAQQNPSARAHLTKVNADYVGKDNGTTTQLTYRNVADHTTQYDNEQGQTTKIGSWNSPISGNSSTNPYDLYFYYDRDRYDIIYMVAPVAKAGEELPTEYELGRVSVPYGAVLNASEYGFKPDYTQTNGYYSNTDGTVKKWDLRDGNGNTLPSTTPVCPNRAEDGKKAWTFNGWALGPAGTTWQWKYNGDAGNETLDPNLNATFTLDGNLRVYATWGQPRYTVTFHPGAEGVQFPNGTDRTQSIRANSSFVSGGGTIPRPLRPGYSLEGWYVATVSGDTVTATNTKFDFDVPVTQDMHVVAKWEKTNAKPYYYRVWHLTNDTTLDENKKYNVATYGKPTNSEGNPQEGDWYILNTDLVNGTPPVITDYKNAGDKLWLAASAFAGYVPHHPNHEYELKADAMGTPEDPLNYFFFYNPIVRKTYTIKYVLAGTEGTTSIEVLTTTGEAEKPEFQPTGADAEKLKAKGYQLAKKNSDNSYEAVTDASAERSGFWFAKDDTTRTATYVVVPLTYNITYQVGKMINKDTPVTDTGLKTELGKELTKITESGKFPAGSNAPHLTVETVSDGHNPGQYVVEAPDFTLVNPEQYVQVTVGTEKQWWKFDGWSFVPPAGSTGPSISDPKDVTIDLKTAHPNAYSKGDLIFEANWKRVYPQLEVTKAVTTDANGTETDPDKQITIPDEEFAFTFTLPGGVNVSDILVYGPDGTRITTGNSFNLNAGETVSFDGLATGATVKVKEGNLPDTGNPKTNWTFKDANGGTQVGNTSEYSVNITSDPQTLTFNNEYHATVDLDTDGDSSNNTNQGLPFTKNLQNKDNSARNFQSGENFNFRIASATGSPLPGTPAAGESFIRKTVTGAENTGASSKTDFFGSVEFTHIGDYTYTIREERPDASQMVPGFSYDATIYRVTVSVGKDAAGTGLAVNSIKLEKRTSEQTGTDYTLVGTYAAPAFDGLTAALSFTNIFDPDSTKSLFGGRKTYVDESGNSVLATGDGASTNPRNIEFSNFQFELTLDGAHTVGSDEASDYHTKTSADDKNNFWKNAEANGGANYFQADGNQPGSSLKDETGRILVHPGNGGVFQFNGITYNRDTLPAGNDGALGVVYKYTVKEVRPAAATVEVKDSSGNIIGYKEPNGHIVYSNKETTLYAYVHLHNNAETNGGKYLESGDKNAANSVLYAEILGPRDAGYVNTYIPAPAEVDIGGNSTPSKANIPVTKWLRGSRNFDSSDSFTFTLTRTSPADAAPLPSGGTASGANAKTVTLTVANNGLDTTKNTALVPFGKISFTKAGTYVYSLVETGTNTDIMDYDTAVRTITIVVKDNSETASLEVDSITIANDPLATNSITIKNVYKPTTVDIGGEDPDPDPDKPNDHVSVKKEIKGRPFNAEDVFTFTIEKGAGTPASTPLPKKPGSAADVTSVSIGKDHGDITPDTYETTAIDFGTITFTEAGTFKYTLKETPGSDAKMTYGLEGPQTLTITVGTDNDGALVVESITPSPVTFTNVYKAVTVDIGGEDPSSKPNDHVSIKKVIEGRPFDENDTFTFTIEKGADMPASTPMPENTSVSIGKGHGGITAGQNETTAIDFGTITFTEAGTYTYTLKESEESLTDMIYDTTEKTLKITVSEITAEGSDKGKLKVDKIDPETITWTNKFQGPTIKKEAPSTVGSGEQMTYTLIVNGSKTARTDVKVIDTLPAGVTYNSAIGAKIKRNTDAEAAITPSVSGQTLTFTIGTLNPNDTIVITIPVTVASDAAAGTEFKNTATLKNNDFEVISNEVTTKIPTPTPPPPPPPKDPDPPQPPKKPDPPKDPDPQPPTGIIPFPDDMILDDLIPLAAPHLNITDHYAYIIGYSDGTVRPEGNITRAEVATIFFRLMLDDYRAENWSTENDFTDVDESMWFNNAVSTCVKAGLLKGYEDDTFRPNAYITRAEFAAIASRFLSDDAPGYDYFTDTKDHWAYVEVARAVYAGWIRGTGRLFRPDDQITRAETVTIVNRMINRFPDKEHLLPDMIRWPDNTEDMWYYEDVQEATNSHDYEAGEFEFTEIWTELLANRDWAALEKEWANAYAGGSGEVAPDLIPNGGGQDSNEST